MVPPPDDQGPIDCRIGALNSGDRGAIQPLCEAYFQRLVALRRAKLHTVALRTADEEDVALTAFDSFPRRAAEGPFPRLYERDDPWQVLFVLREEDRR